MIEDQRSREKVQSAYTDLALTRQFWPNKYNISGLQLAKMLSDYSLLSKVPLLGKKILNIGCSEPVDEVFWVNLVKEWHALDLNRAAITVARKLASEVLSPELYSKLKFLVGDVTRLKFEDETYDVVTAFSSIDHIPGREDRRRAVSEMCRVLKKGGYLVITVPNKWDVIYSYRSNKLQRNGGAVYGYEYQFSPLELRSMLLFQGLSLIDSASTSFNPNSYFDWLLRKLGLAMLKIYFGRRFGYLARKL